MITTCQFYLTLFFVPRWVCENRTPWRNIEKKEAARKMTV